MNEKFDPKLRMQSNEERYELYSKLYLGEIITLEKPEFDSNSLILAPVGSGKSHLIENTLIPKDFSGKALYLTSNSALKDSICPDNNKMRKLLADQGKFINFYTTKNKERYGNKRYGVHVMTYHEFGNIIDSPGQSFTEDVDIIFCDEIHSLPRYRSYGGNDELAVAMNWLFSKQKGKQIYYFTATKDSLDDLVKRKPSYLNHVTIYSYLDHPKIRQYIANSITYIRHIDQVRDHFKSKLKSFNYHGYKGLAFTKLISEQERIRVIAIEEGFKPIVLWSINNERKMDEEQLAVRDYILSTGNIPEPYNLLIINGAMQEGWNLNDDLMRLAILDTTDPTEQVQALGRIRRDIDLLICKTKDRMKLNVSTEVPEEFLNRPLTSEDKTSLYIRLGYIDNNGKLAKWPTTKRFLEASGYTFEEKLSMIDGIRTRVTIITAPTLR